MADDLITLTKIRELDLSDSVPPRPAYLSAASGVVCVHSFIYAVADDELHLGVFRTPGNAPGHLVRLFEGVLPEAKHDRKKHKPDLEALTLLPASHDHPYGALLALGSGSTRNRRMGALVVLNAAGAIHDAPQPVEFSPLLAPLDGMFAELNIEGAVVHGDELRLFQRGTKQHADNAIIRFRLSTVLDSLKAKRTDAIKPFAVHAVDLGDVDGVPLCFTDAAVLPEGEMIVTAVAEDTDDTYNDGPCVAAAIGKLGEDGRVQWLRRLNQPHKVEGVAVTATGDTLKLLLVTDADDPAIPAGMFTASTKR